MRKWKESRRRAFFTPLSIASIQMEIPASLPSDPADIPWPVLVRFVRQLSHDLRNHLNAVELQSAFLGELATDSEMKEEVKRLREMLSGFGSVLQKLSADMGHGRLNPIPYKASDLLEDLRRRTESTQLEPSLQVDWKINVGDLMVTIDPQLFPLAFEELLANAARFGKEGGKITVEASADRGGGLLLRLIEPKAEFAGDTRKWGREPLRNPSHGHYGLGLNRARIILESHGGKMEATHDPKAEILVTEIHLPASAESA
jgi:K+-sensing histidine kinase KdpD